jgi:hypothetical protein
MNAPRTTGVTAREWAAIEASSRDGRETAGDSARPLQRNELLLVGRLGRDGFIGV